MNTNMTSKTTESLEAAWWWLADDGLNGSTDDTINFDFTIPKLPKSKPLMIIICFQNNNNSKKLTPSKVSLRPTASV